MCFCEYVCACVYVLACVCVYVLACVRVCGNTTSPLLLFVRAHAIGGGNKGPTHGVI